MIYRRMVSALFLLLFCGGALGHPEGHPLSIQSDVTTEAKPWTNLDFNNNPEDFQFAIVTDHTGGPREGIFAEAVSKLNLLQPEFVMSIGDFIEGYENTQPQLDTQWKKFLANLDTLEMPFFFVPGNHDNGRPLWAEVYKARFGVEYFSFVYKKVLFVCLSTNDGAEKNTGISQEQIDYVRGVLAKHTDVRWTLVFQHKPLWNDDGAQGWKEMAALFEGRKATFFAGHTHNYLSQEKGGISFITLATTGAGSRLRGVAYGEFDQIAWVTVSDEGPRVANLLLDGILDKDIRTPEQARRLALFSADQAITASPIQVQGHEFSSGTSKLVVQNPADRPLRVRILMETPDGVRVEPASIATVVPAASKHEVDLSVMPDTPIPVTATQPVVLHWRANYDGADNSPSTELSGERRIVIDGSYTIKPASKTPTIDGVLDDWDVLPFVVDQPADIYNNVTAWKGVQDGAFRFGVSYDDEYVYVAVRTFDDEQSYEGWKYWEDFAMVFVDARASSSDDPRSGIFATLVGPKTDDAQVEEFSEGQVPEGVKTASAPTENGFAAEFAIPVAYLNERQGGEWRRVRLNVAFSDHDTRDARDGATILNWRPRWTARNTQSELGVFTKSQP